VTALADREAVHRFELTTAYCSTHDEWERAPLRGLTHICTGCGHVFRRDFGDIDDDGMCAYCGAPYL
jgi:rubrerythrin